MVNCIPHLGIIFTWPYGFFSPEEGGVINLGRQIGSFTQWSEGAIQPIRDMLADAQITGRLNRDETS